MNLKLGVLDFSPVLPGFTPMEAINATLESALLLEQLGFDSLWIGEHHSPAVAHASPEVFAATLAARTTRLRIGVAGILLRVHNPLLVASSFKLLAALYPNTIDLGIARGSVDTRRSILLNSAEATDEQYADKIAMLQEYLRGKSDILISPADANTPVIWMLGSGLQSARIAASLGTAFCFAEFLAGNSRDALLALEAYRHHFVPNAHVPIPMAAIAVAGICAPVSREIKVASGPVRVRNFTIEEPVVFADRLKCLASDYSLNHIVYLDLNMTYEARRQSYELLAQALL